MLHLKNAFCKMMANLFRPLNALTLQIPVYGARNSALFFLQTFQHLTVQGHQQEQCWRKGRTCCLPSFSWFQRLRGFQSAKTTHDDVIKWKHFPHYWPFVRGIHRSLVISPRKGQWRGALMFSLICILINGWVNNRETGDLRRYRAHYDVPVM